MKEFKVESPRYFLESFNYKDLELKIKPAKIEKANIKTLLKLNWIDKKSIIFWNGYTLVYKVYKSRMYILAYYMQPPQHINCKCETIGEQNVKVKRTAKRNQ